MLDFKTFLRRLSRIQSVYADLGAHEVASRAGRRILQMFGRDTSNHSQWLQQKQKIDADYDSKMEIDTGGIDELLELTIVGKNVHHGTSHIASNPDEFRAAMSATDVDLNSFTFVDLGCGKGRALFLASGFPFRRIIGVEFAVELLEIARKNLRILKAKRPDTIDIELTLCDVATFEFPNEPLLVYLFNPFGSKIVRCISQNLLNSASLCARPILILYMNPVHKSDFLETGWAVVRSGPGWVLLDGQHA